MPGEDAIAGDGAAGGPGRPDQPSCTAAVLFQGKRFQRVTGYRRASARHAVAEIVHRAPTCDWFAPFLPQEQMLADPGTRDAMMHAIQCCVPDATLLPQGIEKLYLAEPADQSDEYVVLDARERFQDGDSYIYDIDVPRPGRHAGRTLAGPDAARGPQARRRRSVGARRCSGPTWSVRWSGVLGGTPVGRRRARPGRHGRGRRTAERRAQTALAASRAVDRPVEVRYRPDGKPELRRRRGVRVAQRRR